VSLADDQTVKPRQSKEFRALLRLAHLHGVRANYLDMAKRRQYASPDSLLAVLRTLGVPLEGMADVGQALEDKRRACAQRVLDAIHVAWQGKRAVIPLQLPEKVANGPLRCEWRLETGELRAAELRLDGLTAKSVRRLDGNRFVTLRLPVLRGLPVGYHRLKLECPHGWFETEVFCAPRQCWQGSRSGRTWGLFAPLYALHSERSMGAGDFADLEALITWLSEQGGRFVGTLPLLPAFLGQPCEPSPYSPVSRLFWNEFYLDLARIPELAICPAARRRMQASAFQQRLQEFRRAPLVDYAGLMALKREILETLSRSFFAKPSPRWQVFHEFLSERLLVSDYARFRALHEELARPWSGWPPRLRHGPLRDADCRQSLRQYHLYAQWLAHEQLGHLSDHARRQEVELYLDMPLGVHRDGYDAWRYQTVFALGASGGAPPDPVFTQGQDWGFAPIHPQRSREQGHSYIRAYLSHHLRHARMLRFDHVMGMHRLYWVPCGLPASQGAYVEYPAEEAYAILSIESHRRQALIIGENLGTVPAEVNQSMKRHGISGMFVVQYEARPKRAYALKRIPANVVASLNTHDMPPFAAFCQGLDIADRHELGLLKDRDLSRQYRLRDRTRKSLIRFLQHHGRIEAGNAEATALLSATLAHLGASAARWVLVNLEDLWQETTSQNTPGTSTERVNWRCKTRLAQEELCTNAAILQTLKELRSTR
jgi:4-alpha-glucanotransferase